MGPFWRIHARVELALLHLTGLVQMRFTCKGMIDAWNSLEGLRTGHSGLLLI